uniref:B30.2/SPRY domain-containing protein n=1 Tax=Globodera rostochiensis TaxID=31243 RepID=A0A914HPD4_GLORO
MSEVGIPKIGIPTIPVLTPQNRWDIAACAKDLMLVERKRLIAKRCDDNFSEMFWERTNSGSRSVFAEMPIPKKDIGIFYFELKIGTKDDKMSILYFGLATKQMPLNSIVGTEKGTYAYGNHGQFCCHDEEIETPSYKPFDVGDVVGCGVNLATRRIIYTKNGERLDTADLFVDSAGDLSDLFPCVTLFSPGNKIEANFGPIFTFDIADGI